MTASLSDTRRTTFRLARTVAIGLLATVPATQVLAQHSDVLLQTVDGKIVTGAANYDNNTWTLGTQVYRRHFLSNFRSSDPGFTGFAFGNPNLPSGASGFPSNHNVNFDLLPMTIGQSVSNLFYWDGNDLGGDGLDLSDVTFVVPSGIAWDVFDENFSLYSATGIDQPVPGGLIQTTSADINPQDGVDSGAIHNHLVLQLSDNDGNSNTTPPAGVYMIAWQARSVGFETSDPFLFVHRTSNVSDFVRDLAADWAIANIDSMFGPALPGDYNDDHVVDAIDYTVWRNAFGLNFTLPNEDASPNVVDADDYTIWKMHYGEALGSGAGSGGIVAVPEPSALSFVGCLILTLTVLPIRVGICSVSAGRVPRGMANSHSECQR
jgi:hypothetical protein